MLCRTLTKAGESSLKPFGMSRIVGRGIFKMTDATIEEMMEKAEKDIREVEIGIINTGFPLEHFDLISKYVRAEITISQIVAIRAQLLRDQTGTVQ